MTLTDEQIRQKFEQDYPEFKSDEAIFKIYKDGANRLASVALSLQGEAVPFAWVIPGDDNAKDDGWLDCRITSEWEFTKPLYESPPLTTAQQSELNVETLQQTIRRLGYTTQNQSWEIAQAILALLPEEGKG